MKIRDIINFEVKTRRYTDYTAHNLWSYPGLLTFRTGLRYGTDSEDLELILIYNLTTEEIRAAKIMVYKIMTEILLQEFLVGCLMFVLAVPLIAYHICILNMVTVNLRHLL